MARRKSRRSIIAQAKKLAANTTDKSRRARIKEIRDRYLANIEKSPYVAKKRERNEYLRSLLGTQPTRKDVWDSYYKDAKGEHSYDYRNNPKLSDRSLYGFIGMNTAQANAKTFTRDLYMNGNMTAKGQNGG